MVPARSFTKQRFLTFLVVSLLMIVFAVFQALPASAASKVTQVSTGQDTACAVVDGKVKCWGVNTSGQL
ncbi:MAG: RCC1 domain-containing protein, partial [Candidatus Saccharimonadales bacterium]